MLVSRISMTRILELSAQTLKLSDYFLITVN
jgi:hypothetical protein